MNGTHKEQNLVTIWVDLPEGALGSWDSSLLPLGLVHRDPSNFQSYLCTQSVPYMLSRWSMGREATPPANVPLR